MGLGIDFVSADLFLFKKKKQPRNLKIIQAEIYL